MASAKAKSVKAKTKRARSSASATDTPIAPSVYKDFKIWKEKKAPTWHPVKKMRYIFWRMISGIVIRDAIREIRWNDAEFWHLIDLKREGPFALEYQRAKTLQGRALADTVLQIAEGRDPVTRKALRRTKKLLDKAVRRMSGQKSALARKMILEQCLADMRERDKVVMTRNRLQMDAAKWIAGAVNPGEFGTKSSVALGGQPDGANPSLTPRPIAIQFVGPDGKVVAL